MLTASSKTKADPPPKLDTVEDIELLPPQEPGPDG